MLNEKIFINYKEFKILCFDNSLKVRIAAFQAVGPGSIPGCRIFFNNYN